MMEIETQPIDPHFGQRRERIATSVLAQLVGAEGKFRSEQIAVALEAADALIRALDPEGGGASAARPRTHQESRAAAHERESEP